MTTELAKTYDPKSVEKEVYDRWIAAGAFNAEPDSPGKTFCIVIPPPNVTDKLHVGQGLNNTLQDMLVRHRRMQGFNTLWMPGTDHAGIATQTVVEKRILAEEGRRRTDFAREEFVARIQAWKDEYEARILDQLKLMGCSCDWRRTRFTMDEVCARAVRAAFFKLFADGLIYRGKRLVNWDPATQTVLADDEVEYEEVKGHFWYLRYPLVEPVPVPSDARSSGVAGILPARTEGVSPSEAGIEKRKGRFLPHWTQSGATYAVTFRLGDSVPADVSEAWRRERDEIQQRAARQGRELTHQERKDLHLLHSARIDSYLDAGHGACVLKDPRAAGIVQHALAHFDGQRYDLVVSVVMPNHVHAVFRPLGEHKLDETIHSWKSFTAKEINRILGRRGQLWMDEYYDHLIRDEEDFYNQVNYVLGNPAKAGLQDWPWIGSAGEGAISRGRDALDTRGQDARDTSRDTVITHVTVATTRPETMLGDTAVAMNPADPRAKALVGRKVRLPIVGRIIPIIADDHVVLPNPDSQDEKARFSTGFLKVTPAHDPDDYAIGQRHNLPIVNVMAPDGTISDKHGWDDAKSPEAQNLLGMDRFEAREAIVEWFRQEGLLEDVRDYTHQVGHSYRSHVPVEPYLSDQWYIAVKKGLGNRDQGTGEQGPGEEGPDMIPGTDVPVNSLAGLALAPLLDGRLKFIPERYARTYQAWLENLRDWPISRQLWWGHRIPIWSQDLELNVPAGPEHENRGPPPEEVAALDRAVGGPFSQLFHQYKDVHYVLMHREHPDKKGWIRTHICLDKDDAQCVEWLEKSGWRRDPDVLDTWFSSALWPFSTLGWPKDTPELKTFYPGDVLVTAREIITLWVSRMVMMGQYCLGDIPFGDVFIHAIIQDGEGRKMSKSLGNGIDPLDIIDSHGADAMRFTLCSMTTQTQDVRMPVEQMTLPDGRTANTSPKFDMGRNFCNKLWNASRFVLMKIEGAPAWSDIQPHRDLSDAWILSRLNATIRDATAALEGYRFNELADTLYHFMWDDFCDWYVEIAKARIQAGEQAPKAILAHCLDGLLRLLHPVAPFITEAIWQRLNEVSPTRGPGDQEAEPMLVRARWPQADAACISPDAESRFALLAELIRGIRNVRTQHNVPPGTKVDALAQADDAQAAEILTQNAEIVRSLGQVGQLTISKEPVSPPADAAAIAAPGMKLYVVGAVDRAAETARLTKQRDTLQKGIRSIEGKLGNANFLAKAPADLVRKERQRLESLQADLTAVNKSLEALK